MKLAAIDIGSNSIKLVVVEATASDSFSILAQVREVVRLGHETLVNGHIGTAALLRAADCIERLSSIAEAHGAEKIMATATASVREANNSADFLDAIEHKTGLRVEVLSGIEEARLIGLAAAQGCTPTGVTSLNIDIGGGSTEVSIFRDGVPITLISIKLGAVGLTDRFIKSDPPSPSELIDLRSEIRAALEQPSRELREQRWDYVTATSGTALAISAALPEAVINLPDLIRLNAWLSVLSSAERNHVPGLIAPRGDIIVAGGSVLEEAMISLGIESLNVCGWALREGVIIDRLLRQEDRVASSQPADPQRETGPV